MEKEEIFRLLGVSDETELKSLLNCKSVEYADEISEENYFIINRESSEYGIPLINCSGFENKKHELLELPTDFNERPYICKAFLTRDSLDTLGSKKRKKLKDPIHWECVTSDIFAKKYFHRGHIIASAFGGDKKMPDTRNRGKLSQFIQTKWSNENDYGLNPYCQWHFEEKVTKAQKNSSVCLDSRLIYRNKADKIPIGIHLQAVTEEDSLFNVFLPNVDPDIKIDYKNCTFKLNR